MASVLYLHLDIVFCNFNRFYFITVHFTQDWISWT